MSFESDKRGLPLTSSSPLSRTNAPGLPDHDVILGALLPKVTPNHQTKVDEVKGMCDRTLANSIATLNVALAEQLKHLHGGNLGTFTKELVLPALQKSPTGKEHYVANVYTARTQVDPELLELAEIMTNEMSARFESIVARAIKENPQAILEICDSMTDALTKSSSILLRPLTHLLGKVVKAGHSQNPTTAGDYLISKVTGIESFGLRLINRSTYATKIAITLAPKEE